MLEEAHAHVARLISRLDNKLDTVAAEIALYKAAGVNVGPLQQKIEQMLEDIRSEAKYIDESLTDSGPFSIQKEELLRKARWVVQMLRHYAGDRLGTGSGSRSADISVSHEEGGESLTEQVREYYELKAEISESESPTIAGMRTPPLGPYNVMGLTLALELSLLLAKKIRRRFAR